MKWLALLTLIVFGSVSASANSITYYVDIFGGCTPETDCPVGGSNPLATTTPPTSSTLEPAGTQNDVAIPAFSTVMGTLDDVIITLDTEFIGGLEVINTSSASHKFISGFASVPLSVSGTALPTITATAGVTGLSGTVQAHGDVEYGSGTYTGTATSGILTSGLSAFEVPGSFMYTVCDQSSPGTNCSSSTGATEVGGSNHLFNGAFGNAGGILSITYDYTAAPTVPEPASMFLVGGMLLLGGFTWRRRSKNVR